MKVCARCGAQLQDNAMFCPNCGNSMAQEAPVGSPDANAGAGYPGAYPGMMPMPYDHTAEFDRKDISENKVICMAVYLMGVAGIIIAMLAGNNSPYAAFHVRQALKITVLNAVVGFGAVLVCWIPFVNILVVLALLVWQVVLLVVRVICFCNICSGKAVEPPIVRGANFLR